MSLQDYQSIAPPKIQRDSIRNVNFLPLRTDLGSHMKTRQATPSSSDHREEPTPRDSNIFADITERFGYLHDNPVIIPTLEDKRRKARKDKYSSYSMIIRRREQKQSDGTWISLGTTLEIRDKEIQKALKHILRDVRYINLQGPDLILKHPYRELFWFEKELKASTTSTQQPMETYEGFQNLQKYVISGQWNKLRADYESQVPLGYVTFQVAWTLYRPNSVVIFKENDSRRAYIVGSVAVIPDPPSPVINVQCWGWTCDDKNFGLYERLISISGFDGTSKIVDLVLYPIDCMEMIAKENLKRKLVSNGRKWQSLLGTCHKEYCGLAYLLPPKSESQREEYESLYGSLPVQIEGRVILDRNTFFKENRESGPSLVPWTTASQGLHLAENESVPNSKGIESLWYKYRRTSNYHMSDQQALICPQTLQGFALEDKVWADFQVDAVKDIEWNLGSFKQVQLDENTKNIMESLVRHHERASNDFKDIVTGKSTGLVMLLHGTPGTGKTLTAETLSESHRKPLFRVTSGDLGITPEQAEQKLTRAFRLAGAWNAILLLDEADVFLVRSGDIVRNGILSIFLRNMEWFKGILLITTNRIEDFDEAFKSRIHVCIEYKPPDADARMRIWENIVNEQQAGHELTPESFKRLSQDTKLNGRQIKNLVRVAIVLCQQEGENLNERMILHARKLSIMPAPDLDYSLT